MYPGNSSIFALRETPIFKNKMTVFQIHAMIFKPVLFWWALNHYGLPWWLRRYSVCLQCGKPGFNPWAGKIPWRRKWQSTPVLLPGKSHGQRSLVGYSPWGCRVRCDWVTSCSWIISNFLLLQNSKYLFCYVCWHT